MDQTISSISITNTLSKGSLDEQMSLTWSSVREAKDRGNDAITTERIEPGVCAPYRMECGACNEEAASEILFRRK